MDDVQGIHRYLEIQNSEGRVMRLKDVRSNKSSLISLMIPPHDQIPRVNKMLADEFEVASNISSSETRNAAQDAIDLTQRLLVFYYKIPTNGLLLYTGTAVTDDDHDNENFCIDYEPLMPINISHYVRDNKFHIQALTEVLNGLPKSDAKYGFVVMDRRYTLYVMLSGNTLEILHEFRGDLPFKHGKARQLALHFANLWIENNGIYVIERRNNYVRKTTELATQFFIDPATSQINVSRLILAGSASFLPELRRADMFDPRLNTNILNVVEVYSGGNIGLDTAIEPSREILFNVRFLFEKRQIRRFFAEVSQYNGKYVFRVHGTISMLQLNVVELLLVWEDGS